MDPMYRIAMSIMSMQPQVLPTTTHDWSGLIFRARFGTMTKKDKLALNAVLEAAQAVIEATTVQES